MYYLLAIVGIGYLARRYLFGDGDDAPALPPAAEPPIQMGRGAGPADKPAVPGTPIVTPGVPLPSQGSLAAGFFAVTSDGVTAYSPSAQQMIAGLLWESSWFVLLIDPLTQAATLQSGTLHTAPSGAPSAIDFLATASVAYDTYIDTRVLLGDSAILVVCAPGSAPPVLSGGLVKASSPDDAAAHVAVGKLVLFTQAGREAVVS